MPFFYLKVTLTLFEKLKKIFSHLWVTKAAKFSIIHLRIIIQVKNNVQSILDGVCRIVSYSTTRKFKLLSYQVYIAIQIQLPSLLDSENVWFSSLRFLDIQWFLLQCNYVVSFHNRNKTYIKYKNKSKFALMRNSIC